MLYCARAAFWASISDEDAASVELWRLRRWLPQLHTPRCCLSADIPLTPSDLESICHTGLRSKCPLDWKGMSYMANKGCQGSASSRQRRDILRPRHTISQTWEMLQTREPAFKEKTKRRFSVQNLVHCTICGVLWQTEHLNHWWVMQNMLPTVLCGILLYHTVTEIQTKQLPKVMSSRRQIRLGWVSQCLCSEHESSGFAYDDIREYECLFHNSNVRVCVINDRPVFYKGKCKLFHKLCQPKCFSFGLTGSE